MPIATPEVYAEMLGRAKEHSYRLPGHQLHLVGDRSTPRSRASPTPAATASSSSPPAARSSAPGLGVKDMVTGAVALAEFAHIVAEQVPDQRRAAHRPLPQGQARHLRPAAAGDLRRAGGRGQQPAVPVAHVGRLGGADRREPRRSPRNCSRRRRPPRSSWRSRSASSAARRTASRPRSTTSSTPRPRTSRRPSTRSAPVSTASTCWPRRSATCTASTSRATSSCAPTSWPRGRRWPRPSSGLSEDAKPFDFVFHGGSGSLKSEIEEALRYGVVKMNVDTDTQYAFTRPIAGSHVHQLRRRAQGRRRGRQQEGLRPAQLPEEGRGRR